jgi:hypothetical protein
MRLVEDPTIWNALALGFGFVSLQGFSRQLLSKDRQSVRRDRAIHLQQLFQELRQQITIFVEGR